MKICEIFPSIQGESSMVGIPMLFIRLTGCNLRCSYCDTKYAYEKGYEASVQEVLKSIRKSNLRYIAITGGEPLLQAEVYWLMEALLKDFNLLLETNGSLSIEKVPHGVKIVLDIKTPGSGMSHKNLLENLRFLKAEDEVKFVITNRDDYEWAKNFIRTHTFKAKEILFSPAFGILSANTLAKWILEDTLPVRLNLQIHKFISVK